MASLDPTVGFKAQKIGGGKIFMPAANKGNENFT